MFATLGKASQQLLLRQVHYSHILIHLFNMAFLWESSLKLGLLLHLQLNLVGRRMKVSRCCCIANYLQLQMSSWNSRREGGKRMQKKGLWFVHVNRTICTVQTKTNVEPPAKMPAGKAQLNEIHIPSENVLLK